MNAQLQAPLSAGDLQIILAIIRCGNFANAGERLQLDSSTVFRAVQRIERLLGQQLFERARTGYRANELAQTFAMHAERIETEVEAARSAAQLQPDQVSGSVRLTTTDTVLHGLIAPLLGSLQQLHPQLRFDLHTGNELADLTKRDADIALRATKRPPQHLIGKRLGTIHVALFAAKNSRLRSLEQVLARGMPWVAPDEAMPEHPSVIWRKKALPKIVPSYTVSSIASVMELIATGLGVGLLPVFFARNNTKLIQLGDVLDECQTELWMLTHIESKHLRRVSVVYAYLAEHVRLDRCF